MYVPLDKLYHWLDDLCNGAVIIYRYLPPGSKNIRDCTPLYNYNLVQQLNKPHAWFHDQECLESGGLLTHAEYVWTHPGMLPLSSVHAQQISTEQGAYYTPSTGSTGFRKTKDTYPIFKKRTWVPYQLYKNIILVHSELDSDCVNQATHSGYVPVHWLSHAVIARDWYRYANYDKQLDHDQQHIQKLFLIYNRSWKGSREYRLYFADQLIAHNLATHCNTKLALDCEGTHYRDHRFIEKRWQVQHDLAQWFEPNSAASDSSADYDYRDYQQCWLEVVLETHFEHKKKHFTEKTFRPIAVGRPFMLLAGQGSLALLRRYGFETFSPWIDETYDTILDRHQRLKAVLKEMQRLSDLSDSQRSHVHQQIYAIADRNRQWFFSQKFIQQVANEFTANLAEAVNECNHNLVIDHWQHWQTARPDIDLAPLLTDPVLQQFVRCHGI